MTQRTATPRQVRYLQEQLNHFTRHYLYNVAELRVDGKWGPSTERRVRWCKYYLGYKRPLDGESANALFYKRLQHPTAKRFSTKWQRDRAHDRRVRQRKRAHDAKVKAERNDSPGVTTFDGRPCARWLVKYLVWARQNGWHGTLVSGYRSPAYSTSLCIAMCGRPSCSGTCAGARSNHSGSAEPRGALDVTYWWEFGQLMRRCPYSPRIFNALPRDRVHFSATGN